jgi:hypothetical protein
LLLGLLFAGVPARVASANVVINAQFDGSITSGPNSAAKIAGINNAIAEMQSHIANNVTVNIQFVDVGTGTGFLGQNSTQVNPIFYSAYRSDLLTHQTLSAADNSAIATLPSGSSDPVTGSPGVTTTYPLLRALGESALGDNGGGLDSTVYLAMGSLNLLRTGPQDPTKYDLQTTAMHELSEVLGAGGLGSSLNVNGVYPEPLDLYRYSAAGVRSYTTSSTATSYFSIDGGVTNVSNFNQKSPGDYGDWAGSPPDAAPQVQDAFGTPGTQLDLGPNELTALDVIGWDLAVPEPSSAGIIGLAAIGILARWRRRSASAAGGGVREVRGSGTPGLVEGAQQRVA